MIRLPRLPVTQTVTASELHIATGDGEAMFFHDTLDFSAYADDFYFEFIDSANKIATAYSDAAGAGESTGSNLLEDSNFEQACNVKWSCREGATISAGKGTLIPDSSFDQALAWSPYVEGQLFKMLFNIESGTNVFLTTYNHLAPAFSVFLSYAPGENVAYATSFSPWSGTGMNLRAGGSGSTDIVINSFEIAIVTDVPTTGLRLRNLSNVRNMQSVETGFNPNAVTKIRIWRP